MANPKTKIVSYRDDNGRKRQSIIPIDADDSDAEMGLPISFNFPPEWEPHREQIEAALIARGITPLTKLNNSAVHDLIRQALQQVIRMDVQTFVSLNKE